MRPARLAPLGPRHARRAHSALLLFIVLAIGSAMAGMLSQHLTRPAATRAPGGVVEVPVPGATSAFLPPVVPSGTPTADARPMRLPLGPLVPVATVTILPPSGPATAPDPGAGLPVRPPAPTSSATSPPTRPPAPTPTRPPSPTPTRTPTRTPTPTPVVASPQIAASATGSSYRSGAFIRGKVAVSGLPSGYVGDVTLRLHGPFSASVDIDCGGRRLARTETIRVTGNGTWSGAVTEVTWRGFYVWEASLPASASSHAASSPCPTRAGRFEVTW